VVTVAGAEAAWLIDEVDAVVEDALELSSPDSSSPDERVVVEVDGAVVVAVLCLVFADSAGSLPCAIWTARPPVRASAAATAMAVILAVNLVMPVTLAALPQRTLGIA
jgi:hypothetical protein